MPKKSTDDFQLVVLCHEALLERQSFSVLSLLFSSPFSLLSVALLHPTLEFSLYLYLMLLDR